MHPTADTLPVIYFQRRGAAGDGGRWAAYSVTDIWEVCGPCPHERKELRVARGAWFSSAGWRARVRYCAGRAPRYPRLASPPNKRMHPTADTRAVIKFRGAARRVMRGVRCFL